MGPEATPNRVFVSYSRRDGAFARELLISLDSHGFETFFDSDDLTPGDAWAARLEAFINKADSVAYVVSSHSVASQECAKELAIAIEQGKRVIPLMLEDVAIDALPDSLRRLQFVFFHGEGRSFAKGMAELTAALRTDADWVHDHTRLTDQAREWRAAQNAEGFLLRGAALQQAQAWLAEPTPPYSSVTQLTKDYIEQSLKREEGEKVSQARAQRRRVLVGILAAILAMALVVALYLMSRMWFSYDQLNTRVSLLQQQVEELAAENAELRARAPNAPDTPTAARQAHTALADLSPYFEGLASENPLLRRGMREDLAARLNLERNGDLNRQVIARARAATGRDAYRVQLGVAFAVANLDQGAPISDPAGAAADLRSMCETANEPTLRANVNRAIARIAPGEARCG